MSAFANFLRHLLRAEGGRWYPLLSVYYLTYRCSLRCSHCSDGSGQPYHQLNGEILSADRVLELLRRIRLHSEHLVFTGGEPLEHPEAAQVLRGVAALKFRSVILTTNGVALDRMLPDIAASVTHLVVSLQTLDPRKADAGYGRGPGVHELVRKNLAAAAAVALRRFEIILSSVVTPDNIPDLYEVYAFAKANGFRLAACPHLLGVKAHPALAHNHAYHAFYDFLIAEKRRGARVQGTVDYLEHLRDLRRFACRPFTMLVVSPVGDVFYPCLELGQHAGNLLTEPDLHRLREAGLARFGPQPECDIRCHSACALGFSRLLARPGSAVHEGFLLTKSWLARN